MRGYGTSTAPYASANAHVKSGSFVLNDRMPGSELIPVKPGWLVGMETILAESGMSFYRHKVKYLGV